MAGMNLLGYAAAIDDFQRVKEALGGPANKDVVYVVGTDTEYAAYVEFGTSKMEAQPYLFPAARRVARDPERHVSSPDTLDQFIREIALAIEAEAKQRAPVDTGQLKNSIRATRMK